MTQVTTICPACGKAYTVEIRLTDVGTIEAVHVDCEGRDPVR